MMGRGICFTNGFFSENTNVYCVQLNIHTLYCAFQTTATYIKSMHNFCYFCDVLYIYKLGRFMICTLSICLIGVNFYTYHIDIFVVLRFLHLMLPESISHNNKHNDSQGVAYARNWTHKICPIACHIWQAMGHLLWVFRWKMTREYPDGTV